MDDFPNLKISSQLKIVLFMVDYATSYTIDNGNYKFVLKTNFLGMPDRIPFPLLFNSLINQCYSAMDVDDMYNRLYESKNPMLIKLAEQFRDKDIGLSRELFDFIKRKECSTEQSWQLSEIQTGSWNYTLLTLNETVWKTAFDFQYLSRLFQNEKKELDAIVEGRLYRDGYPKYLERVDRLIHQKLA
jgi:hypothetical protein